VPIDGFYDHSRRAIVLEEIIPQGGQIVLAGQVLSTGNGRLRVANGYTSVDIDNRTGFDLVLNRIDTTTDRKGTITIIDTARLQKDVYDISAAGGVQHRVYQGTVAADPVNNDGVVETINYTLQSTGADIAIGAGAETFYATRPDLHYVWVEGQALTKTTITKYEKNSFNLLGDNALADWLVGDNSWVSKDVEYTDKKPLLESETLEQEGALDANNRLLLPAYATDDAYTIRYQQIGDPKIDAVKDQTKVYVGGNESTGLGGTWYLYKGENAKLLLPSQTYAGNPDVWAPVPASVSASYPVDPDPDVGVLNRALNQYPDSFQNKSIDADTWTTGGGWLRYKTVHTKITEIEGLKDVYTHTLKADYAIAIDFIQGVTSPTILVNTVGNLILEGDMESPEHGTITLKSQFGSITGADTVAIYGATPEVRAGQGKEDVIRLNIEGNKIAADADHDKSDENLVTLRKGELVERNDGLYRFTGVGKIVNTRARRSRWAPRASGQPRHAGLHQPAPVAESGRRLADRHRRRRHRRQRGVDRQRQQPLQDRRSQLLEG
jgi:hypothetical protein